MLLYICSVKCGDVFNCVIFSNSEEAEKYRAMHPNKEILISGSYFYEKAEDAIAPQKLSLAIKA